MVFSRICNSYGLWRTDMYGYKFGISCCTINLLNKKSKELSGLYSTAPCSNFFFLHYFINYLTLLFIWCTFLYALYLLLHTLSDKTNNVIYLFKNRPEKPFTTPLFIINEYIAVKTNDIIWNIMLFE